MDGTERRYRYVGPDDVAAVALSGHHGHVIRSSEDFARWIGTVPRRDLGEPFTYVVDTEGILRLAPRRSEHVACAAGGEVLAAGEIGFDCDSSAAWTVTEVSNQSTGYCPDPSCWPAVAAAVDRVGLSRPNGFTSEFVFRRCAECQNLNIVKDDDFTCQSCGTPLAREDG